MSASAELAEAGGPSAVTVRAAARTVGVTATAAYRHFANHDELLAAVRERAQQSLFDALSGAMAAVPIQDEPVAMAIARLYTAGRGYIEFAERERGLFRTAFCHNDVGLDEKHEDPIFDLISVALDGLVAVGFMDQRQRADAEFAAWSAVHGLASLIVDGPLAAADNDERERAIHGTIATVLRGFATGPDAEPYRSSDPHVNGEPLHDLTR
ncbi:TetR/AcrR family transcriptional regulator [Nocardia sp. 004]|uniref:TetR/AcrR family transcriptional regulator n=1 Tax=Nocardia sp. 004 TaxID=3385978 RepID=UPI00399F96FC